VAGPNTYIHTDGVLLIGDTGTEVDYACQVSTIAVEPSVDTEDDTPVLCGDTEPGASTYSANLTATVFQDLPLPSTQGLTRFSWDHKGEKVHVRYIPNDTLDPVVGVDGTVVIQPMNIGGDLNTKPTSDIEWPFVGFPTLSEITDLEPEP
jgi:hypothetical protein